MNFLAHTLLGFNDRELIAGQVCGDFIRGSQLSHLPQGIEIGIRLHRFLDVYTDSHPALQTARSGINDVSYRFSGIVIDVMFDHYLALNWCRLSAHMNNQSLRQHAQEVDAALSTYREYFPEKLQRFMVVLADERILEGNIDLLAIELTLARLSRRSAHFSPLALKVSRLSALRSQLQPAFELFYPDLRSAASDWLESRSSFSTSPNPRSN